MSETKKRVIIIIIFLFSLILIFSILKINIGINSDKDDTQTPTYSDNIKETEVLPSKEIESTFDEANIYVTSSLFTNNGFKLSIHIDNLTEPKLVIKGNTENSYNLTKISENSYEIDIDITNFINTNYFIYIKTDKYYSLVNKLDLLDKINRAKINDKLLTFDYKNNIMTFKIENFNYKYDILIDPGHGGIDGGTYNGKITEASLNLLQSLYEKERYEAHGLKVQLSRNDNSEGMMMGDFDNWNRAKLRGYAIGYNGVFAKIIYSNHHNSYPNSNMSGFEILVSNKLNKDGLDAEIKIANELLKVYPDNLLSNPNKIYSRDIETGSVYNKINGKVYNYTDYYATIRIPLELFNVKTVTYEGAYMSSSANFDWYYNGGWKKVSEAKIKHYVEALGKTYIPTLN